MEIAPVLPFDATGAVARPAPDQPPEEPFGNCLGSAVGLHQEEPPPPEAAAAPNPDLLQSGVQGEPTGDARKALDAEDAEAGTEVDPDRQEGGAGWGEELSPLPVAPITTDSLAEVAASSEPTGLFAATRDTSVEDRPRASHQPPVTEMPPVPGPVEPGTEQADAAGAAPPELTFPSRPDRSNSPGQLPDQAGALRSAPPETTIRPDPARSSNPIQLPDQATTAATEPWTTAWLQAKPGVAEQALAPSQVSPADAPGIQSGADQVEAEEGTRGAAARGRLGAERLWGYWLRHGGGGAARAAVSSGTAPGQIPTGQEHSGETSMPAMESSRAQGPVEVAAGAAGAEPGIGGTSAAPDTRAEPTPATTALESGGGVGHGPDRLGRAVPSAPRAPAPPPQPPQQVANAVRVAVLRGGNQVTVHLEPEALGKVQVVLVNGDEGVRASFRVENPLTQQTLQADAPMLKQALEARGVNVAHVSVELDQGDRQGRDPLARHSQGRRRRFGGEDDGEVMLDDLPLRPEAWRPWGFEARA